MENLEEMPHMLLKSGKAVDLELEMKSKWNETKFFKFMISIINGKEIVTKYNLKFKVEKKDRNEFLQLLLNNTMLELFVNKFYGNDSWERFKKILGNL